MVINSARSVPNRIVNLVAAKQARTRSDLVKLLELAPSTISGHVTGLLQAGLLIEEAEATAGPGRPQALLALPANDHVLVAIEIEVNQARAATFAFNGDCRQVVQIQNSVDTPPQVLLEDLLQQLRQADPQAVYCGCAMAIAAPVNAEDNTVMQSSRLPQWDQFSGVEFLSVKLGIPVTCHNDADCVAIAEHQEYQRQENPDVTTSFCIRLSAGMSSGLVIDNELFSGATGVAGEISHVRLDGSGEIPCLCGQVGCLETVVAGASILSAVQRLRPGISSLSEVVTATRQGDTEVLSLLIERAKLLGRAAAMLTNFINPQAVFLSGTLFELDAFTAAVRAQIFGCSHPVTIQKLQVLAGLCGREAILRGAFVQARNNLIQDRKK